MQKPRDYPTLFLQNAIQIILFNIQEVKLNSVFIAQLVMITQQFQILNMFMLIASDVGFHNFSIDPITSTLAQFAQIFDPQDYMITTNNIWLIPLFINLFQLSFILINAILYMQQNTKINKLTIQTYIQSKGTIFQALSILMNCLLMLQNHILVIPITRMLLSQFKKQVSIVLPCVLIYIISIFTQVSTFILVNESITVEKRLLQRLKTSFSDVFGLLFQHLIAVIYEIDISSNTKLTMLYIGIYCYYLFQYNNVINSYATTENQTYLLYLYSFNISFMTSLLFQEKSDRFSESLFLVIAPILCVLLNKFYSNSLQTAFITQQPTLAQLQFKIASLTQQIGQKQQQNHQISLWIYLRSHQKVCVQNGCGCSLENKHIKYKQFIRSSLTDYMVLLSKTRSSVKSFSYYLHYISVIQLLGLHSKALQQTRNIMNEVSLSTIKTIKERSKSLQSSSQTQKDQPNSNKQIQYKVPSMNLIERQKLEVLQTSINSGISSKFEKGDVNSGLQDAIQMFLRQEDKKKYQVQMILQIISNKRKFIQSITQTKMLKNSKLIKSIRSLISEIKGFLDELQSEYSSFPSQRLQGAISFLYGEILNNYSKAFNISQVNTVSDERLLQLHRSMTIDLFSNKLNYMILSIDAHLILNVKQRSQGLNKMFGYSYETFNKMNDASFLLPNGFQQAHQKLVQSFLQTGNSKFYQQTSLNYAMRFDNYLRQFDFFFDIDLTDNDNLNMITFFQQSSASDECYCFVNVNEYIGGISKEFYKALGYTKEIMKATNVPLSMRKVKIHKLVPDFETLISFEKESQLDYETFIQFIKPDIFSTMTDTKNMHWVPLTLNTYTCNIDIYKRYIEDHTYYILKFKNIRLQQITITEIQEMSVSIKIQSPQKNIKVKTQLDISYLDVSQEDSHNIPNSLDQFNQDQTRQQIDQLEEHIIYQNIVSPKDTSLMDNSRQQLYFQSIQQHQQSNSVSIQQSITHKEAQVNHGEEAILRKQIEQQLKQQENDDQKQLIDMEEIGSQVSQLAGFRRSKYYKKYDLYDRLNDSTIQVQPYKLSLYAYIGLFIISLIYAIIALADSQTDLNRFLKEIDLLSIKPELFGPVQNYVTSSLAYINYFINVYTYGVNLTLIQPYLLYSSYQTKQSYADIKSNYINLTNNPYLQQFFTGVNITVYQQNGLFGLSQREFVFREAIQQFVNAQFTSQSVNPIIYLTVGTNFPFVTYIFKNLINLSDQFDQLSTVIYNYSIQRSNDISRKWYLTMAPIQFIAIFLLIFAVLQFYVYKLKLKFFVQLIAQQDQKQLAVESLQLRLISDILEKENDIIYNYKFDIDVKEAKITQLLKANNQEGDKIRNKEYYQKAPPFRFAVFCNTILIANFIIYSWVQNIFVQKYVNGYQPSIEFYQQMSNLSCSVGSVYVTREIMYFTYANSFYFYTNVDIVQMNIFFLSNMKLIQAFINQMANIPNSQILSTQTFDDQFTSLKSDNICQFLSVKEYAVAKIHCLQILGGIASRGLQLSLNSVYNDLNNEYSVNQFKQRPVVPLESLELGIIIYSVMAQMRNFYKQDLITQTQALMTQFVITSTLYIIILLIGLTLLITIIQDYFKKEFNDLKHSIFLINSYQLFVDDNCERKLRQFTIQNQLI